MILNVQSYAGGKNLWGWPGFATLAKVVRCWINRSVLFSVLCQIWMHFICDCHYISLYAFTLVLVFFIYAKTHPSSVHWTLLWTIKKSFCVVGGGFILCIPFKLSYQCILSFSSFCDLGFFVLWDDREDLQKQSLMMGFLRLLDCVMAGMQHLL